MSERMNKERAREILKDFSQQLNDRKVMLPTNSEIYKDNEDLLQALDIAIDSLDNTMTNREYMHLVGVRALFDTNFNLDKPLEKEFVKFLYALNQVEERKE